MNDEIWQSTYSEFSDPRLAAIYNTVNPIDGYQSYNTKLTKDVSSSTITDIRCGSGLLTFALAAGHHLIGVEPTKEMLWLAQQSPYAKQVRWLVRGVEQLKDFAADLAIMTGHVAQFFLEDTAWQTALSSIYKSLRAGGYVAFESCNPSLTPFADWPTKTAQKKVIDFVAGKIEWWHEMIAVQEDHVKYVKNT